MQGHADIEVPDQLDVAAIIVHDDNWSAGHVCFGDLNAFRLLTNTRRLSGTGNGPRLNTPIVVDVADPRVRREGLLRQSNDLRRPDVDFEDVRALLFWAAEPAKVRVIDPLAVE